MSVLITGDLQAEWSNLDLCQQAWDQVLSICDKRHIKIIVVAGDHKRQYNPIDARVALWWQRAIRTAKKKGIVVICVLGNHDRVGQYTDSVNWLPILRRAGAITFDKPGVYDAKKYRIFILPFSGVDTTRRNAKELLRENPDKRKDILIFHQDIKGAQYNAFGQRSDSVLRCSDLHSNVYKWCIGGHIHQPQVVQDSKNIYYVGSPFCTDWGEVNQSKRFLVYMGRELTSI